MVDTGFDGSLIVGEELFDRSDGIPAGAVVGELASNQIFQYEAFLVEFDWLGGTHTNTHSAGLREGVSPRHSAAGTTSP